jgi:hypothetical protein
MVIAALRAVESLQTRLLNCQRQPSYARMQRQDGRSYLERPALSM